MNHKPQHPEITRLVNEIKKVDPTLSDCVLRDAAFDAYQRWTLLMTVKPAYSGEVFDEIIRSSVNYIQREKQLAKTELPIDGD